MPEISPMINGQQTAPVSPTISAPQATPAPQNPTETVPRETKETDSQRFASLSRKERELQRYRRQVQEQTNRLKQERESLKPWAEAAELAKTNKLQALARLGITPQEVNDAFLMQEQPTPEFLARKSAEEIAQAKIDEYRKQQEESKRQEMQANYDAARNQIRTEAQEIVTSRPNDFPLVKKTEQFDTVVEYIEQEWKKTNRVMPMDKALADVEAYLKSEAIELLKTDSLRDEFLRELGIEKPQPSSPQTPPSTETVQQPRTLSHKQTTPTPASRDLSAAERRKRAEDIFYGRI